jgi:hypothetical protein
MLTQFYGTVSVSASDATITGAHSNNVSVRRVAQGQTRLTLNEWVAYQPCVLITPEAGVLVRYGFVDRYTLEVSTASPGGAWEDASYSFALVCGRQLSAELASGHALEVSANISSFGANNTPVLVLSVQGVGELDKGTVLVATTEDDSVQMTLAYSTLSYQNTTYHLNGYTYTSGQSGPTPWPYTVKVPANTGISSPLESFRVTATAPDGTVLTSDPIAIIKKKGS